MQQLSDQIVGNTKVILLTVFRDAEDPNDWTDSTARLVIARDAPSGRSHLATITEFDRLINTPSQQQVSFTILPAVTAGVVVGGNGLLLVAGLEVSNGGNAYTAQATWTLRPAVPAE